MKNLNKLTSIKLLTLVTFSVLMFGCDKDAVQSLPDRNFELVWSDEFDGNAGTLPDATKWTYDLGNGAGGWGNQELQNYTNATDNVSLDGNGNLVITAIRNGNSFTSGRIKTQGLYAHKFGKIEARIKTPFGPGIWPAFWMLGENIDTVGWPNCGEIDIMELKGHQPHIIYGTLHGPGYSAGNAITKMYGLQNDRFDNDFHIFAIEWQENQIDFFVDGYLYKRVKASEVNGEWVYNQPFFMILNLAVGGNFVGFPTDATLFPQKMYVDYVRAYKSM